jgi:hypothetical protein
VKAALGRNRHGEDAGAVDQGVAIGGPAIINNIGMPESECLITNITAATR